METKMVVVQLSAGSFAGLVTVGLYLHDCSLTDIDAALLAPLNSTLRYLWLNGNELDHFDVQLAHSFTPLHHLRLGSNPLRCYCSAAWLRLFYERHVDVFRGALPPSCFRPARLRGLQLGDVDPANLRCRPPSFTALDRRPLRHSTFVSTFPRRHTTHTSLGNDCSVPPLVTRLRRCTGSSRVDGRPGSSGRHEMATWNRLKRCWN